MNTYETLSKYVLTDKSNITIDLDKSHGSWLVDDTGRERLDLFSQYASQPLGWNHPKVKLQKERLYQVVEHNISNPDFNTPQYVKFVETFASFAPDFQHFFFISGGTLGVENAIKAACDYKMKKNKWNEDKISELDVIHFKNAFHGRSGYTLSTTNTSPEKYLGFPKFAWSRFDTPTKDNEQEILDQIQKTLNKNLGVACILAETIQGEGGDYHFTKSFMQGLRKLSWAYEVMLILDEVQCGMSITGKKWAYEHLDITPDLIAFSKKAQVAGCASTKKIDEIPDNVFKAKSRISSTWGGNLVDMVRSTIFMEIIKEDKLTENAAEVGSYFQNKLSQLGLQNLRGKGFMIAFDLPNREDRDNFLKKINDHAVVIKCGEKSIRLRPHLTFGKEEADIATDLIKKCL